MVYITIGPDPGPLFKHSAFALTSIGACFPFIHAMLDDGFEFTPNSLRLDERPFLAPDRHMATGQHYQTKPATQHAPEDPFAGP
jgi:hypothetical protein